jgi:hypothetical protein
MHSSSSPFSAACPSHITLIDLIFLNYTWQSIQVMKLLTRQLPPTSSHFIFSHNKCSFQRPVPKDPQSMILPQCWKQSFISIKIYRWNYSFVTFGRTDSNSLIPFGIRANCLMSGRILLYQLTKVLIKLTAIISMWYHFCLSCTILLNIFISRLSPYIDENTGDNQFGFWCNRSALNQIFAIMRCWRKNGSTMRQYTSYL